MRRTQGPPVPGVEMRIVDIESGAELPWDGEAFGEVQVRGPWIISGYYHDADADRFTADGWFRTGDVATIDADGYMSIVDRTKDVIKSGGEWISTVELENAIMAHPKVLEATVIAAAPPEVAGAPGRVRRDQAGAPRSGPAAGDSRFPERQGRALVAPR